MVEADVWESMARGFLALTWMHPETNVKYIAPLSTPWPVLRDGTWDIPVGWMESNDRTVRILGL